MSKEIGLAAFKALLINQSISNDYVSDEHSSLAIPLHPARYSTRLGRSRSSHLDQSSCVVQGASRVQFCLLALFHQAVVGTHRRFLLHFKVDLTSISFGMAPSTDDLVFVLAFQLWTKKDLAGASAISNRSDHAFVVSECQVGGRHY